MPGHKVTVRYLISANWPSLLKLEGAMRYWAWLMLQPVRYNDRRIEEIFPELVEGLADILQQFLNGNRTPEVTAKEFLIGATLLKGINYKPEREVRIVAIPGTAQAAKYAAKEFPAEFDTSAPLPEIEDAARYGQALHRLVRRLRWPFADQTNYRRAR